MRSTNTAQYTVVNTSPSSTASTSNLAACVMVLGCTSGAGKSWLATALCRWYAQQGYRVAPFKAQNMSNNARVVAVENHAEAAPSYGEIGTAQYFQALAAHSAPDVRMNPILLKPESDTHSQVVCLGQVNAELTALPWRSRSAHTWGVIENALHSLRQQCDVVVIEGAGSPAEINLAATDVVNMRVARHVHAACLLVADIDRGGAFAHLYGTWSMLPQDDDRALLRGFVLNKFRGDAQLLAPAPEMLHAKTGVSVLATIPWQHAHGLPEEDSLFDATVLPAGSQVHTTIAIIAYPRSSNLDEFQPLSNIPNVALRWVRSAQQLHDLGADDWIILPGSKATIDDLHWLRAQQLDTAICQHAAHGRRVLGICAGLQMLGAVLVDSADDKRVQGLGLLPLATTFATQKTVCHTQAHCVETLTGSWSALAGVAVSGYEIHCGCSQIHHAAAPCADALQPAMHDAEQQALAWVNAQASAHCPHTGNVLGMYVHGFFENAAVLQALFGQQAPTLEQAFNRMAEVVDVCFGAETLHNLARKS